MHDVFVVILLSANELDFSVVTEIAPYFKTINCRQIIMIPTLLFVGLTIVS